MIRNCPGAQRVRLQRMTGVAYYLCYRTGCTRGGFPGGEGDFLLIDATENSSPLCLFLPVRTAAEWLFASTSPPDSLLFDPVLRQALLTQHLEELGITLLDRTFTLAQISLTQKADDHPAVTSETWYFNVPTSLGSVALWAPDTVAGLNAAVPVRPWKGNLPDWCLPVHYRVGWCHISLRLLHSLAKGDVVVVMQRQQSLTLAGQSIGQWNFNEQGIVMESMDRDMGRRPGYPLPEQNGLTLQDVEVTVEIVLGDTQLPLAQAMALEAGDFVPLMRGGVRTTQLRLGNQTIARGELVEIDGQMGVILETIFYQHGGQQ